MVSPELPEQPQTPIIFTIAAFLGLLWRRIAKGGGEGAFIGDVEKGSNYNIVE